MVPHIQIYVIHHFNKIKGGKSHIISNNTKKAFANSRLYMIKKNLKLGVDRI